TASAQNATVVVNNDGTISYTPDADYNGTDTITVTSTDDDGAVVTQTSTITVNDINDAPTITITDTTATEDIAQVIANVSDIDGTIDSSSLSANNGTVTIAANGDITYTPNANYNGVDSVTISVTDNDGLTTSQTFDVTVAGVNDAPDAIDDNYSNTAVALDSLINTHVDDYQSVSSISSLSDGGWVATWSSHNQDGSYFGVYGQAYNADGTSQGDEFQVNSFTTDSQANSSTAGLSDGGWVVTWESEYQDGSGNGIYAQAYNADGTTQGNEFKVNSYTSSSQENSSITGLNDGGWIVTWSSYGQDDAYDIYAQTYNADGTTQGGEFQVNSFTTNSQSNSSVTSLSDGGWVVTWGSNNQDGSDSGVYGQAYNPDGTSRGNEFQINSFTTNSQDNPSVASLSDGGWIVTWESDAQDGSSEGIYAQAYNADGTTQGSEFQVNSFTTDSQQNSSVTGLSNGGWVVTWESDNQDGTGNGIYTQAYNADGTTQGSEFQVVSHASYDFYSIPSITGINDGGWVVTFTNYSGSDPWFGVNSKVYNADGSERVSVNHLVFNEDTSLILDPSTLLGNDTDADGDTLSITSVQGAVNGVVVLNGNGTITFTPDTDYFGEATFTYTITDSSGGSDTATVILNIESVNNVIESGDIMGTSEPDILVGTDGDDTIYASTTDISIDGGLGNDTLVLTENVIDFSTLDVIIQNIENIDVTEGAHDITLKLAEVLDMTDSDNLLRIDGDGDDTIHLDSTEWTLGDFKTDAETGVIYQEATAVEEGEIIFLEISTDITIEQS
ncbi:MAG: tandem-95 repeat protein, partial [Sulfurimonas sp.]|nr:tandem-95 repeat protein [Sulfurimonas sp.]